MKKISLLLTLSILFFFSCEKEEPLYDVDPAFEEYVQRFITAGAERGVDINFDDTGLLVEFSDLIVNGASGFCFLGEHHIVIDKTEWNTLTDNQKEFLIFHELGHCELDRRHENVQFNDDTWKSLMRGDPLVGTQERIPVPYFGFRIPYYIDELFNENATAPDWSTTTYSYDDILETDKQLLLEQQDVPKLIASPSGVSDNFEIDIDIKGQNLVPFITEMTWGNSTQSYFIRVFNNFGIFIGIQESGGKDQRIFYHPTFSDIDKITVRNNDNTTQVFLNEEFLFFFDPLSNLNRITLEARDGNDLLVTGFSVEHFRLNEL